MSVKYVQLNEDQTGLEDTLVAGLFMGPNLTDTVEDNNTRPVTSEGVYNFFKDNKLYIYNARYSGTTAIISDTLDPSSNKTNYYIIDINTDKPSVVDTVQINGVNYTHEGVLGTQFFVGFDYDPEASEHTLSYLKVIGSGGTGSGTSGFIGTQAEWDALSDADKDEYEIVNITDDNGIPISFDSEPTEGSYNPVTSDGIKSYVDTAIDTIPTKFKIYHKNYTVSWTSGTYRVRLNSGMKNFLNVLKDEMVSGDVIYGHCVLDGWDYHPFKATRVSQMIYVESAWCTVMDDKEVHMYALNTTTGEYILGPKSVYKAGGAYGGAYIALDRAHIPSLALSGVVARIDAFGLGGNDLSINIQGLDGTRNYGYFLQPSGTISSTYSPAPNVIYRLDWSY